MKYFKLILFLLFSFLSTAGYAATYTAADCNVSSINTAIGLASDGDTVNIPAGSCDWGSSFVSWSDKSIAVIGAGKTSTIISCNRCFNIVSNNATSLKSQWRLSSMTLQANAGTEGTIITWWDNNSSWHYGWRIDNMKLDYPAKTTGYGIFIGGMSMGVIDHNDITFKGIAVIVSSQMATEGSTIPNLQGVYAMSLPLNYNSNQFVYIEDNTFTGGVPNGCAAYDSSSGGGWAVVRHNVMTGCMVYAHWTRAFEVGPVVTAVYNNKFIGNAGYSAYPGRLEAGTGVIYNNTTDPTMTSNYFVLDEDHRGGLQQSDLPLGPCDGAQAWDGNFGGSEPVGWPCLGQIGRAPGKTWAQITGGDKQTNDPIYLWNNGTTDGCYTGGACTDSTTVSVSSSGNYVKPFTSPHSNGEYEYRLNGSTAKPGYVEYVYPHPLNTGATSGSTVPVITSALTATAQLGTSFSYTITCSNTPTSFTASGYPAWSSFTSPTISGTPNATGTTNITIGCSNASGSDSKTLVLTTTGVTIGDSTVHSTVDHNSGLLLAQKETLSGTGSYTLTSFKFYVGTAAGNLRLALYDDDGAGGNPGTLLAETASTAISTTGWVNINPLTNPTLTPGNYWLVHMPDTTSMAYTSDSNNASAGVNAQWFTQAYGAMPSSLSAATPAGNGVVHWGLYAEVTSASGSLITSSLTASGTVSSPFSYTITCSNTPTSFTATGLPLGTTFTSPTISGTLTTAGTVNSTIGCSNASGGDTKTLVTTIAAANTTTALSSSPNPSGSGQNVVFNASVTPSAATGTIAVKEGVATLCTISSLVGGSGSCSTSGLSVAAHTINAIYSGDSNYNTSTSSNITHTVNATASLTTKQLSASGKSSKSAAVDCKKHLTTSGKTPCR